MKNHGRKVVLCRIPVILQNQVFKPDQVIILNQVFVENLAFHTGTGCHEEPAVMRDYVLMQHSAGLLPPLHRAVPFS